MSTIDNKRIAKNTLMLYIRQGVTMLIQLYTSRVILQVLGIDNYGIWSLVAILVVSISFITGPLTSATQRYLNVEIGKRNEERTQLIFSQNIILYSIFSFIIVILLETIGLYFLNTKLNIPSEKIIQANIIYQLSIVTFVITFLRLPYDSIIIAYEKMQFYAFMSIIDVVLKLSIVYLLLIITTIPSLILYGILTLLVTIIITIIYIIYCSQKYSTVRLRFVKNISLLKELASFSGWSILGAFAVMLSNQGVSMVLNIFFGVAINAALGIMNQVGNAVNQFVSNFQIAFQPQIVKNYACQEIKNLELLIYRTSKFSFILLLALAFPIIYNINNILYIWLGNNIPSLTSQFICWLLACLLVESVSAPLWMTIQATGKIKYYQITISCLIITNIIFSYIILYFGLDAISVMYVRFSVGIICFIVRLKFIILKVNLPIKKYIKKVLVPCLVTLLISSIISLFFLNMISIPHILLSIIVNITVYMIILGLTAYFTFLSKTERNYILQLIFKRN